MNSTISIQHLKTRVERFYNIFNLGFNGDTKDKPLFTIGYGFGTAQRLGKGWSANADLTGSIVFFKHRPKRRHQPGIVKFALAIEKKIGSRFALFAGPSVNTFFAKDSGVNQCRSKKRAFSRLVREKAR